LKPATLALVGGKIYPSPDAPPIDHGTIILSGGKIERVGNISQNDLPSGAKVIDCSNYTTMAGFQNSHVHLIGEFSEYSPERIEDNVRSWFTRYGFTTVVDAGSNPVQTHALRSRIHNREVFGPRILTACSPLYPKGGIPYYLRDILSQEILGMLPQPSNSDEARRMVRENVALGADVIKLFTASLVSRKKVKPMELSVAESAVQEAHKLGKLVYTHPSNFEGVRVALDSEVDILAHTASEGGVWSKELVDEMITKRTALVPTLKLWLYEAAKFGATEEEAGEFAGKCVDQLEAFAEAGGQVLFGTDAGYMTDFDPTLEYVLMSKARMNYLDILGALTSAPATVFGESKIRGRIEPGMKADVVVLKDDPERDVRNFTNVVHTVRDGEIIFSSADC
jgi:imidazolonepropionase-like amidohydrolase